MIPVLPRDFNFLGFSSSDERPLTSIEKQVLSRLRKFDELEAIDQVNAQFATLKKIHLAIHPSPLKALPLQGGWHRLKDGVATPSEPSGEWLVFDCETSKISATEWRPLCAVASNGKDFWVWLPNVSGEATELRIPFEIPFIAHNSAYDASFISGNPGSLCTMAIAAQLWAAPDYMLHTMKTNRFVPWSSKSLPAFVSLETLAQFLRIPMHLKDTRKLCITNTWDINYRQNLLEILNYCLADVLVTVQVFEKIWPHYLRSDPHPLSWLGLFEISKFQLPFEPDMPEWIQKVEETVLTEVSKWVKLILDKLREVKARDLGICQQVDSFDLRLETEWVAQLPRRASNKLISALKLKQKAALQELESHLGKIRCKHHAYFNAKIMAPEWVFDFAPTPTNKSLPTLLGFTFNGQPIKYKHPHFNILDRDGQPCGTWWSSEMDTELLDCEGFDAQGYAEFSRNSNPWRMLSDRMKLMRITGKDDRLWFTPEIHKCGTVSARLTDNLLHVAPKHNKKVPGTELLGKIKAPEGFAFIYADYSGQETMIFQALCDQGVLGSSGYGRTVLTGDMHSVVRDLMGFEKTKEGRSKAKGYTFLVQYGGGAAGCAKRLILDGMSEPEAVAVADQFIDGYKGKRIYSKGRAWYKGGLASEGYNTLESLKGQEVMRTLLFHRAQSLPMQRAYRGSEGGMTLGNWPIQSTGSDFLRGTFAMVSLLKGDVNMKPICSIHDLVCFLVPIAQIPQGIAILQAAHLYLVAEFYKALKYPQIPALYGLFDSVEVDSRLRLKHLDPYVTPSNPDGFPIESCLMPIDRS